jgi:RNA-binding protein
MDQHDKHLRSKAKLLSPILQIGKNGLTQGSLDLISRELEHKQLIKLKLLKGALPDDAAKGDRRALAQEIAVKSKAQLVEQVGNIVVLYKA